LQQEVLLLQYTFIHHTGKTYRQQYSKDGRSNRQTSLQWQFYRLICQMCYKNRTEAKRTSNHVSPKYDMSAITVALLFHSSSMTAW